MLIRTHPMMTVLYSTREARLKDLPAMSGNRAGGRLARELYQYVADLDLFVCGPQYWFYHGVDGQPDTPFTLEVALPVQGKIPTALLPRFKQIPAFRCLSSRYEGPWEGISEEYDRMIGHIKENHLKMSGIYAESFLHIDLDRPGNQITEIQIGLC